MSQAQTVKQDLEGGGSFSISSPHLQYVLDALGRVVEEARFKVGDGLIKFREVDAAHVALCHGGVPLVEQDMDPMQVAIPVDTLKRVMKPVPLGEVEPIVFEVDGEWVTVVLPGDHRVEYKQFDTAAMTDPKIPNLDLDVALEVKANDFYEAVKRADNVGANDHIRVEYADEGLVVKCEGARLKHRSDIEVQDVIRARDDAVSLFSLDYIRSFTCAKGWQGTARIELGNDYPIPMKAQPGDATINYLMAPRIKSE